jgi:hypothetical protein
MHMNRLHAAIAENAIETALKARALEAVTASRARLKHLPLEMSNEALRKIVSQLGLPIAAAAAGDIDVRDLDTALAGTGLNTSDKIRLKNLLIK